MLDTICNSTIHMYVQAFMVADKIFQAQKTSQGLNFSNSIQYSETCSTSQLSNIQNWSLYVLHASDNVTPRPYANLFHAILQKL